jgi:hypothetical protein
MLLHTSHASHTNGTAADRPFWQPAGHEARLRKVSGVFEAKLVAPLNRARPAHQAAAHLKLRIYSKSGDERLTGGHKRQSHSATKSPPTYTVASPGKRTTSLLFVSLARQRITTRSGSRGMLSQIRDGRTTRSRVRNQQPDPVLTVERRTPGLEVVVDRAALNPKGLALEVLGATCVPKRERRLVFLAGGGPTFVLKSHGMSRNNHDTSHRS